MNRKTTNRKLTTCAGCLESIYEYQWNISPDQTCADCKRDGDQTMSETEYQVIKKSQTGPRNKAWAKQAYVRRDRNRHL